MADDSNGFLNRFMWWHLYHHAHSIRVSRDLTRALRDTSLGRLYSCECGRTWAK